MWGCVAVRAARKDSVAVEENCLMYLLLGLLDPCTARKAARPECSVISPEQTDDTVDNVLG